MILTLSIVRSRCRSVLLSNPSSSFRVERQSQPNPMGLNLVASAAYAESGRRQSHCAYLDYFQHFRPGKASFSAKRLINALEFSVRRGFSTVCVVPRRPVGLKVTPTVEAGMCFGVSRLLGKLQTGLRRKPISYNAVRLGSRGARPTVGCGPPTFRHSTAGRLPSRTQSLQCEPKSVAGWKTRRAASGADCGAGRLRAPSTSRCNGTRSHL